MTISNAINKGDDNQDFKRISKYVPSDVVPSDVVPSDVVPSSFVISQDGFPFVHFIAPLSQLNTNSYPEPSNLHL